MAMPTAQKIAEVAAEEAMLCPMGTALQAILTTMAPDMAPTTTITPCTIDTLPRMRIKTDTEARTACGDPAVSLLR